MFTPVTEHHGVTEIGFLTEGFDEPGRILEAVGERGIELWSVCHSSRSTHLGDEFLAQFLQLALDRFLQLFEAPLA